MTSDQTIKGILTAFAAFLIYSLSDASVKLIEGGPITAKAATCLNAYFTPLVTLNDKER